MTGGRQDKEAQGPPPQGTEATGGTRPKDSKTASPPSHPPPQDTGAQVLQLTPELFQQTVAAAVTAALTAAQQQQPQAFQTQSATPVIPRKEKKLAEFWTSRPTMWFRLFQGQFPDTLSEDVRFNALLNHLPSVCLLYTSPSPRDLSTSRMPSSA